MAQNMNLTADEATKFWPIFDQYRKEAIKPNDERWALIKEYAANYSTMTDAQAQDYIQRATDVDKIRRLRTFSTVAVGHPNCVVHFGSNIERFFIIL
jgi:hypothetical protein